jgi:hypothetical protein
MHEKFRDRKFSVKKMHKKFCDKFQCEKKSTKISRRNFSVKNLHEKFRDRKFSVKKNA